MDVFGSQFGILLEEVRHGPRSGHQFKGLFKSGFGDV